MIRALPGLVVLKILVFYSFGLYHGIWRHAGTPEVVRLVKASTLASGLALAGLTSIFGTESVSLSVVILDWMIATGDVGGARFGFRALRQYFAAQRQDGRRALVYGSHGPGLLVLRHLRYRSDRTVVGLLDADATRHGLRVQGVDVLGGPGSLPEIVATYEVDEVILPVENTTEGDRQMLAEQCAEANVDCRHFAFVLQPAMHTDAVLESSTAENGTPAKSRSAAPSY